MDSSIGGFILILGLVALKMLITGSYRALMNVSKSNLRDRVEEGDTAAKSTLRFAEDSKPLLVVHQYLSIVMTSAIVVAFVFQTYPIIENQFANDALTMIGAYLIGLPILGILLFIFTEHVPTGFVMSRTETVAMMTTKPIRTLTRFTLPIVNVSLGISHRISHLLGGTNSYQVVTEEEIKTLVDAGSEEGVLEDEEKEMIYSVIRFGDTIAREVMLPRIDMVALDIYATLDEALDTIIARGHSRIPVYRESIDNIEGVLYAKDLLEVWKSGETISSLEHMLREPHFVPETKKASELLIELQSGKIHMVFVVDEYGGTAGLVTLEDLVEEIIGEIQDEYDRDEEATMQKIDENTYIFNARIDLDDLNHLLDCNLPSDEIDTLGGFIFSQLGRVPSIGDQVTTHDLSIEVLSVTGRRIRKVKVNKIEPVSTGEYETVETKTEDIIEKESSDLSTNTSGSVALGEQN